MFTGVRVVRGPDWEWGDQDGGRGCVGTVVPAQAKDSVTGVFVRWDSGVIAHYRAGGASGKYDLRIYDNAQLGIKHPTVVCDCCKEKRIVGIRWKCLECHDFDLCHHCYNEGKHDLGHRFTRIETNSVPGVEVPCRSGAVKCRSFGICVGARVVRGPDWEWEDQDGGDGKVGTVSKVCSAEGTYRSWVSVQWPDGSASQYRRGHKGKVDVQYTERETMGEFYIEHLPRLDETKAHSYLDTGDKVRLLDMDHLKLKELHLQRRGWSEEIKYFMGKVGEVVMVDKDGDVKVNFGGSSYFIHPLCLVMEKKEEAKRPITGDMMTTLQLKALLEKLGDRPGGSADSGAALFKAAVAGNTTKVLEIINDHPEAVKFQNKEKQTPLQAAVHHGHMDAVTALLRGKAPLDHKDVDGDTALAYAVLGDKPEIVKCLLQAGSNINTANNKDFTPLHQSIVKGHQTCAEVLLTHDQQKCDVNYKDKHSNSPLHLAITKNRKQIISLLITNPETDLRQMNKKGFNSLHHAALCGNARAVEGILEALPNMINDVTGDGFTALHIAAQNGLSVITLFLVKQGDCDKELKTNNGQTALHLAVDIAHKKCIEALVNYGANVNAQNSDGDTSLHLVMKASIKDIMRVTPLEKLLELVQQLGDKGVSSAKKYNLVAITVYLIKHGADIYIKNKTGSNVLDVCPNPGVENLLKDLYQRKESTKRCVTWLQSWNDLWNGVITAFFFVTQFFSRQIFGHRT